MKSPAHFESKFCRQAKPAAWRGKMGGTEGVPPMCSPAKKHQLVTERALRTSAAKPKKLPNSAAVKARKEFEVTARYQAPL
jgi:hypothetical protein